MALPYVLIDFENVQPKVLDQLRPGAFRVKVFLGQHQSKLTLELVQKLQSFGSDAEYIQIQGSGPDAVDFHIAFYIGLLSAQEPSASFTIVSKDKGFDPLVRHLAARGTRCQRLVELPQLAATKAPKPAATAAAAPARPKPAKASVKPQPVARSPASTTRARVKEVLERLGKSTKPKTLATLRSSIKAWFTPALDDHQVDSVLQSLQASRKVLVTGSAVTYSLG